MSTQQSSIRVLGKCLACVGLAGAGVAMLALILTTAASPSVAAQPAAELCVTPHPMVWYIVLPDLQKGIGGISSRYVITNQGTGVACTFHTFCTRDHSVAAGMSDEIEASASKVYGLIGIADVSAGYRGYAVVQSDWPITGTVDASRDIFSRRATRTSFRRRNSWRRPGTGGSIPGFSISIT